MTRYSSRSEFWNRPAQCMRGFTLVEIAIVLVIVGLLLGGLLMPLATQVDSRRIEETRKAMEEIKEAIVGYTLTNGILPCPADPTIATGAVNAGIVRATCTGANALGVVPWASLGVSETDAWGRRFTYRVTSIFADTIASATTGCATAATNASFALCSPGDNDVSDGAGNIANDVPAVIVSHGKNGYGAYTPAGGAPLGASPSANENENAGGTATQFFSRTHAGQGAPAGEFDDIVTWVVPGTLNNRMVAAGRLP